MKLWDNIWKVWQECEVPPIQIKEFIIGENGINTPWFWIVGNRQVYFERPAHTTAYHLAVYLKDKDEELIAAYKLYAYLRYYNRYDFFISPIKSGMEKYNLQLRDWWHPSAKNVLPDCSDEYIDYIATEKDWKKIVLHAAETWRQIAQEWAIIIIPDFMDYKSEKYKEFMDYSDKVYKEREYQEFLRLKGIYENK